MTPAHVNLTIAVAILATAAYVGWSLWRRPATIRKITYLYTALVVLAVLGVVTATPPVVVELEPYSDAVAFLAGVLRGIALVLLVSLALTLHRQRA